MKSRKASKKLKKAKKLQPTKPLTSLNYGKMEHQYYTQ